jgi:hypothetical protein
MMTQEQRAALREAASKATPGPWALETVRTTCGICHKIGPFPSRHGEEKPRHACLYADYPSPENPADQELAANARYIALAHPAAVLALLDECERMRGALAGLLKHLGPNGYIPGAGEPATRRARAALGDNA